MPVDDRERSAKLKGSHGDKVALLDREPLLVFERLVERSGLFEKTTLALHEGESVITEDGHGSCHFARFIIAVRARNHDFRVLLGECVHSSRQIERGCQN
jgi:hypothetical protein